MPDHVHMIITPEVEFGVSNMMQSLVRRYARYIHKTYKRTKPLWERTYKSSLIDSRNYLFACMCYVEVNPVRSKIVEVPSEYKWSSYQANAYNKNVGMLHHHPMYADLGDNNESRSEAYLRLFCSRAEVGSVHTIRNALHQEMLLGTGEFNDSIDRMVKMKDQAYRADKLIMKKRAA
jgi:putative transposase